MEVANDQIHPLVIESGKGDKRAFETLYTHLVDRIFGYVRSRTETKEDATDLTQEVFVDLYKALPRFTYRTREQFYAFVFKITKRRLAKHYGHKHTKARNDRIDMDERQLSADESDRETTDAVHRALQTLDETSRDIVVLHHWSRYTFPEIASLLGMTDTAVRVRHHRAQHTLSNYLNSHS